MKNVKNVSLNYVKGFKCVGDVNYYLGNLPRLNGEKSRFNRDAICKQVRRRNKIDIPVEVEIVTETDSFYIELNYKLERMQKINGGSSYDCSIREQSLGLITLNFEDLRKKLGEKVKEQVENYMASNADLRKENEDMRARYINVNEVLTKKLKENDTLTNENTELKDKNYALTVKNTQLSNKVVALEKELNARENVEQKLNTLTGAMASSLDLTDIELRFLVENIIKMNNKGKSEMEIFKKVKDYIGNLKGNKKQK
jgi:hypothetical protein